MRNTNKCPKCGGDAICSVPGGGYANVNQPHFHLGALVADPDDIAKVTDKFGST
jgi:hypothetical protein